jgi:hypothetical protein
VTTVRLTYKLTYSHRLTCLYLPDPDTDSRAEATPTQKPVYEANHFPPMPPKPQQTAQLTPQRKHYQHQIQDKMKHLVLVGACYLDTILTVPHFPPEDAKLRATSLTTRRGGNCPNTVQVFHQLVQSSPANTSVTSHLISPLPSRSSPATQQILSSFDDSSASTDQADGTSRSTGTTTQRSVLNFKWCLYREEHTSPASSYIVRSTATSSRTIINYNELEEMSLGEFVKIAEEITSSVGSDDADGDADGCWWHFEVCSLLAFRSSQHVLCLSKQCGRLPNGRKQLTGQRAVSQRQHSSASVTYAASPLAAPSASKSRSLTETDFLRWPPKPTLSSTREPGQR